MIKIRNFVEELSSDKLKLALIGLGAFSLVLVYALSSHESFDEKLVVESKQEDFKNADIVSDRSIEYYRAKDKSALARLDKLKISNDSLIEKISKMEKRFLEFDKKIESAKNIDLKLSNNVAANGFDEKK